eukprot:TRINITY_DN49537_c0_g1_i1.p1 TRINITY_DN49537_c0_g1~~TRINITY_DN49537_c0_g1_i1.p1  ORF type:complete len:548 (+),score=86.76 TRINITY_DN49537_c0_g1_i1:238-1644(+)
MNAGNAPLELDGDDWIPEHGCIPKSEKELPVFGGTRFPASTPGMYDLIAVGLQEADLGGFTTLPRTGDAVLQCHEVVHDIAVHLGDDYRLLPVQVRGAMMLAVFVSRFAPPIRKIEMRAENTGLAHVWHNKGGILMKLEVGGKKLCFISAHLAANQEYTNRRDEDVSEILTGTQVEDKRLATTQHCHHSFFFGDLNYRLEIPREILALGPDADKAAVAEAQRRFVVQKIEAKDFAGLLKYDQLHSEIKEGKTLTGFNAALPAWPPTYKVTKGVEAYEYDSKRLPAYCDRILWKSLPSAGSGVQLLSFQPAPRYVTSDHKPVRASFAIAPEPEVRDSSSVLCLQLSGLRAEKLPEEELEDEDNLPVLRFSFVPDKVAGECEEVEFDSIRDGSAILGDPVSLQLRVDAKDLRRVHLLIEVWRQGDDSVAGLIGAAPVSLTALDQGGYFQADIVGFGERRGCMRGCISMAK